MTTVPLTRQVPVLDEVEVCVIGGGPAGVAAAVAARRCGKRVMLLEQTAQLGGMATLGAVAIWMPIGTKTGFYEELCSDLALVDHHGTDWDRTGQFTPLFSPFAVRHYFNHKLEAEGVIVHFHMAFIAASTVAGRLDHLVVSTRQGLRAVRAGQFIDCTGNASVAVDAGVETHSGREADGATQPMTLMFTMQDTGKEIPLSLPDGCPHYETVEQLPQGRLLHWENKQTGTLLVNMTRVRGHATRIADISRCEREAMAQVYGVVEYLQRHGFSRYVLAHVGPQIGVRETYQIVGRYTLTEADLLSAARCPDVATQNDYEIDIHNPSGGRGCDERKLDLYDIPYRCLVPARGPVNLLVAGRCLSASHVGMSSARVMPVCFGMGQAAGAAASAALDEGCAVADIDLVRWHERLYGQGVRFLGHRPDGRARDTPAPSETT